MVVDTKLYDLLGVSPTANEREIKKAFRKKACELHPDKNRNDPKATEKFQAVNEAYEVLKDAEKRAQYDQFGPDGIREEVDDGDFDRDIFSHIFGFGGFSDFGSRRSKRKRKMRTKDLVYELNVPLEELYTGSNRNITIQRQRVCSKCKGKGVKDGVSRKKCPDCGGSGSVTKTYKQGGMHVQYVNECPKCNGTGEYIDPKDQCPCCKGKTTIKERKTFDVNIKPGMKDGESITFIGESDDIPGCEAGDLIVVIKEENHPIFKRQGDDLFYNKKISFAESILGYKFTISTLDGRTLVIEQHDNITASNDFIKIEDEGMPIDCSGLNKGNLIIEFKVLPIKKDDIPLPVLEAMKLYMAPDDPEIEEEDPNVFRPKMEKFDPEKYRNQRNQRSRSSHPRKEAYKSDDYSEDDYDNSGNSGCTPM